MNKTRVESFSSKFASLVVWIRFLFYYQHEWNLNTVAISTKAHRKCGLVHVHLSISLFRQIHTGTSIQVLLTRMCTGCTVPFFTPASLVYIYIYNCVCVCVCVRMFQNGFNRQICTTIINVKSSLYASLY